MYVSNKQRDPTSTQSKEDPSAMFYTTHQHTNMDVLRDLSQPPRLYDVLLLRLRHVRFVPNSYRFIIHQSSFRKHVLSCVPCSSVIHHPKTSENTINQHETAERTCFVPTKVRLQQWIRMNPGRKSSPQGVSRPHARKNSEHQIS
jgi:hypothetical protein